MHYLKTKGPFIIFSSVKHTMTEKKELQLVGYLVVAAKLDRLDGFERGSEFHDMTQSTVYQVVLN